MTREIYNAGSFGTELETLDFGVSVVILESERGVGFGWHLNFTPETRCDGEKSILGDGPSQRALQSKALTASLWVSST